MAKQETAEQKLLKMIETSGGIQEVTETQQKVSKEQSSLGLIKKCNLALLVVLIALLGLFANEIFKGMTLMGKNFEYDKQPVPAKVSESEGELIPSVPRLSSYLANVDRRNIFMPYEEAAKQAVVAGSENRTISQKAGHLRLVGIAWLDSVDSATAMLEDVDKKMTYVLMKGEKIDDVTVKTIYADSVKLGYKDEEIILKYDKSQM